MSELKRTIFYERHLALGAKMVGFGGWEMPVLYPTGIVDEHLSTRKGAGLFDVSHMGRFIVRGPDVIPFLQHVLTNNAEALDSRNRGAQYTLIPNERGGAVDDAYLYRFQPDEFLLVVNAANKEKDWGHLKNLAAGFDVHLADRTREMAMLSLQGPASRRILKRCWEARPCPIHSGMPWVRHLFPAGKFS